MKTIMDSVHGYIAVPSSFITNLIDDEYFQRLRNVDQTGMKMLYPNAKHDRFSHSLGVYHLGRKAVKRLIQDIKMNYEHEFEEYYWDKNEILFLIACLLHDIGHAPFSHSLEQQILDNSKVTKFNSGTSAAKKSSRTKENSVTITEKLKDYLNFYEEKCTPDYYDGEVIVNHGAPHEQTGALLVLDSKISEKIRKTIQEIFKESFLLSDDVTIFCEDDLCFIARMIIGLKYTDWHPERQIRNAFIELLNGENFDVDALDYIVRDTIMSGISNVSLDVERLLNSICVVVKTRHLNKQGINEKAEEIKDLNITKITNENRGRKFILEGNIRGKIIIHKNTKVSLQNQSEIEYIKGLDKDNVRIKYINADDFAKFTVDSIVMGQNGEVKAAVKKDEAFKQLLVNPCNAVFEVFVKNGKLLTDFEFIAEEELELDLYGNCHIEIEGRFTSKSSVSLFEASQLDGEIDEVEIIGNTFNSSLTKNKIPTKEGYNIFSPAYDKKAVNLIANVLNARNYLYLWIYAQHKVVYYANFAIPIIAKEIFGHLNEFKKENPTGFPNWELNYTDILFLDDFYIWTVMKFLYYKSKKAIRNKYSEVYTLIGELLTHKYKKSLYKSLVEYDLIFEQFTSEEKRLILNYILKKQVNKSKPFLKKTNDKLATAGYLKNAFIEEINELPIMKENNTLIKELIFVTADYKEKKLKTDKAYIKMNGFATYNQIPLFEMSQNVNNDNKDYFYLYYELEEEKEFKVNEIIQKALIEIFRTKLKNIKER